MKLLYQYDDHTPPSSQPGGWQNGVANVTGIGGGSDQASSTAFARSVKSTTLVPDWYDPCTSTSRPLRRGTTLRLWSEQFSASDCGRGSVHVPCRVPTAVPSSVPSSVS